MNIDQPLSVIADLAFLADTEARERLVIAGLDEHDAIIAVESWPLGVARQFDDAALTITRWPSEIRNIVAVAYSESLSPDLQLLAGAITASARTARQLLRAGSGRWRAADCQRPRCCPRTGNRYAQAPLGHPAADALPERAPDPAAWRTRLWDTWQDAIRVGLPQDGHERAELARSLTDIPLRDALLAQSARNGGAVRPALRSLMHGLHIGSTLGVALPLHTCLAALLYLDGDVAASRALVNAVLLTDEYSLARLLRNGLDMRAPSSLLARSFAHFDPIDLLAA